MGVPIQSWTGGVTPSSYGRGKPHPVLAGGTSSSPGQGGTPIQTWDGVPPCPDLGYPSCPDLGWGTPQSRRMGYPPRLGIGYPFPHQLDGVPPLKVEQTHTCENITSRRTTYAGGKNSSENHHWQTSNWSRNTVEGYFEIESQDVKGNLITTDH